MTAQAPRHALPSLLFSLDDEPWRPSPRLLELAAMLAVIVPTMNHPLLSARAEGRAGWFSYFPGEHYHLLTALCSVLQPANVWEFGTDTGMGSVAMLEGLPPHATVTTVDLDAWDGKPEPWLRHEDIASGRVTQLVCDMISDTVFVANLEALTQAELILVDGPKNGSTETVFLQRLASVPFRRPPIVVFDDTRLLNMVYAWRNLEHPKLDLTSYGHWSGTGLVDWRPSSAAVARPAVSDPAVSRPAAAPAGATDSRPILMLCHPKANYVPDLLLHGLRKLHGPAVVEFPRKDGLYDGRLGQDNLDPIPHLMASDATVDRTDVAAKMAAGFFQFVFCDIRAVPAHRLLLRDNKCRLAVIDGEDLPFRIKPGPYVILRRETDGDDFSLPLQMGLPVEVLDWIERYSSLPKRHSVGFLGSRSSVTPQRDAWLAELVRVLPDSLLDGFGVQQERWRGRDAYYQALQGCALVLSLPGAGLDTFRYWENAACHAVHAAPRVPLFIPDDFRDGQEILRFNDVAELTTLVERVLSGAIDGHAVAQRSRHWLRAHHTTEQRATQTLARLERAFRT